MLVSPQTPKLSEFIKEKSLLEAFALIKDIVLRIQR